MFGKFMNASCKFDPIFNPTLCPSKISSIVKRIKNVDSLKQILKMKLNG